MAHASQNLTVSLTLPISCQICLGKVRQPVICGNCHVFCSRCIELWLRKASHCPACRIPITSENPCKEIIGATNESECNDNSVKKKLRKSRFELLVRDYEDEIEALQIENEELRKKNFNLEAHLKIAHDSSVIHDTNENKECKSVSANILEDWKKKLETASDAHRKVQLDIDKMKEANRTLRAQNVDLVRENLHLKSEVESRSPQKFGRYTVAALEAKISRYERDVEHLRKALERSDGYIEELEARLSESTSGSDKILAIKNPDDACHENLTDGWSKEGRARGEIAGEVRVGGARRRIADMEQAAGCSEPEVEMAGLSGPGGFLAATLGKRREPGMFPNIMDCFTPEKQSHTFSVDPSITPSTSLSCLSLKNLDVHGDADKQLKPLSYLRKLSFDDCRSSTSATTTKNSDMSKFSGRSTDHKSSQISAEPLSKAACIPNVVSSSFAPQNAEQLKNHKEDVLKVKLSQGIADCQVDLPQMSEVSMELAHSEQVSEQDMMSSEYEHHKGCNYSFRSTQCPDVHITVIREHDDCKMHDRRMNGKPVSVEEFPFAYKKVLCSESEQNSRTQSSTGKTLPTSSTQGASCTESDDVAFIGPDSKDEVAPVVRRCSSSIDQLPAFCGMHSTFPCLSSYSDFQLPQEGTRCSFGNPVRNEATEEGKAEISDSSKRKSSSSHVVASPSKMSKFM